MLRSGIKSGFYLLITVQLLFFASCNDDDLKNAPPISSKKITLTKDRSYGVEFIYSDSAIVKAKVFAPILDKVTPSQGGSYSEMPSGVKIEFFNELLKSTGTITSSYAINKQGEKLTVFKRNVVVVTQTITFKTEELTWDENKKMFFSPYGTVTDKDGSVLTGTGFSAPQDFSTYNIVEASGTTVLKGDLVPK
jgi:hypothetical protein